MVKELFLNNSRIHTSCVWFQVPCKGMPSLCCVSARPGFQQHARESFGNARFQRIIWFVFVWSGLVSFCFVCVFVVLFLCVFSELFRVVCLVFGFDTCKLANTILLVRLFGQGFQHLANAISHVRLFSVVCFGPFVCVGALDVLVCLSISGGMPPSPSTSCGNGRELVICCSGSNNLWAHCFANLVQMFVRALSMNFLHSNKLVSCHGKAWEWLSDGSEVAVGTVGGGLSDELWVLLGGFFSEKLHQSRTECSSFILMLGLLCV